MKLGIKPLIPGFFADPDMIEYQNQYYLYPTTDGYENWSGSVFHAFSSTNLETWKEEGVLLDLTKDVPWAVGAAWAPAVCEKAGRFYFFFCGKRPDGVSCIGVAVSDYPAAGFLAESKPLLTPELLAECGVSMSQTIDPSIYTENGRHYLLFGNGRPAVVRLQEDLRRVIPETMRYIEGAVDFREALTVLKRDGIYHFTWSCDDTGSENYHVKYGTSKSLYGPITYHYKVLEKCPGKDIFGTGHHCIFKHSRNGNYYIGYHRFATPTHLYQEGKGYHRELALSRLDFDDRGLMKPVVL